MTTTTAPSPTQALTSRIEALTAQLTDAERGIAAAEEQVAQRRAEACTAALAARDFDYCVTRGLFTQEDRDYRAAMAGANAAVGRLALAHTAVVQATSVRDDLLRQIAHARLQADGARRRAWVLATRPDLVARLDAANAAGASENERLWGEQVRTQTEALIADACRLAPSVGV